MLRTKIRSQLLELVDSDSEDGLSGNAFGVVARASTSTAAANIGRPRKLNTKKSTITTPAAMPPKRGAAAKVATASKVTKPEPKDTAKTRRAARRVAAAVEQEILGGESANAQAENAPAEKPAGRGRGRRAAAASTPVEEPEEDTAMTYTTTSDTKTTRGRPKNAAARKASATSSPDETTVEIPETQPSALEPGTPISDNETHPTIPPPQPRSLSLSPKKRPTITTASSEAADLRRRLGDLTKSHTSLESKYTSLRDLTLPQAEKTFDSFRKQSESKSKLADSLIASLKAELATAKQTSSSIPALQNDLSAAQAKITSFEAQIKELNKTITEQKTEIKALNMKLTAARNAEAVANSRSATAGQGGVPGSAMKKTLGMGARGVTGQQVQEATLAAQRKEDLYADLTGLIVRGVSVQQEAVEFDCLQTGRNGTLHFKLTMSSGDGDESQCEYNPMLDTNRDRALIDVLPEFLVDEIAFPRAQAGKFYQRIMRALNES